MKDHKVALLVLVLTILASVLGIIAAVVEIRANTVPAAAPPTASTSAASASPAAGPAPPPAQTPSPTGTSTSPDSQCFDEKKDAASCDEFHAFEAIEGNCDVEGAVRFLDGLPGTDVPYAPPRRSGELCLLPTPSDLRGSGRGALTRPGSDQWRRCLDRRVDRVVRCSIEHTGEYVAALSPEGEQQSCLAATEAYLDQSLSQVDDLLNVQPIDRSAWDPDPAEARCVVVVRGSQALVSSVRNLGVQPVPIQ